jgi:hypothetical protein
MAKSALIAVAVALLLGGTSLAAAKTKNAAGTHRSPSHPGVNEQVPGVHEEVINRRNLVDRLHQGGHNEDPLLNYTHCGCARGCQYPGNHE